MRCIEVGLYWSVFGHKYRENWKLWSPRTKVSLKNQKQTGNTYMISELKNHCTPPMQNTPFFQANSYCLLWLNFPFHRSTTRGYPNRPNTIKFPKISPKLIIKGAFRFYRKRFCVSEKLEIYKTSSVVALIPTWNIETGLLLWECHIKFRLRSFEGGLSSKELTVS